MKRFVVLILLCSFLPCTLGCHKTPTKAQEDLEITSLEINIGDVEDLIGIFIYPDAELQKAQVFVTAKTKSDYSDAYLIADFRTTDQFEEVVKYYAETLNETKGFQRDGTIENGQRIEAVNGPLGEDYYLSIIISESNGSVRITTTRDCLQEDSD